MDDLFKREWSDLLPHIEDDLRGDLRHMTVKERLTTLQEKWEAVLANEELTPQGREAYELALRLVQQASTVSPNKALRSVQNPLILRWGAHKDLRDQSQWDSRDRVEHQLAMDAYRALREDIATL